MVLEIPHPEVEGKHTWKASAEQKPQAPGDPRVVVYTYEIFHEDGTKTERVVTETDGVKLVTREEKSRMTAPVQVKKPIEPPQNLPENATYEARRVVFTDEDDNVTTTVNYTIFTEAVKYAQAQVYNADGTVTVTTEEPVPLEEKDKNYFAAKDTRQAEPTNEPVVTPPKYDVTAQSFDDASSEPSYNGYVAGEPSTSKPPPQKSTTRIRARGNVAARYLQSIQGADA